MALSVERSRPYKRGGPPGRYPAHCSAEFGLSSVLQQRPSGPAANDFIIVQADKCTSHRPVLSLLGREEERIHQQGHADQQWNQSGEINRLVGH